MVANSPRIGDYRGFFNTFFSVLNMGLSVITAVITIHIVFNQTS